MLELIPLILTAATVAGYLAGLVRLRRRGDRWSAARTACLLAAALCVAVAVLPPLDTHDEYFPVHIVQHLLLAMLGPALLALSAPITLALRTVPRRGRRRILRVLHSRGVRVIASPPTAVLLELGALYMLYLTGLYSAAESNDVLHAAVHLHMFTAGYLLSWVIIGIDPIRRPPPVAVKLAALIVAGAGHDTLAKLMYAHDLPTGGGLTIDRHIGAELMYYGGTIIDIALAAVLMTQWWRVSGRALTHTARRSAAPATKPRATQRA